MNCAGARSQCNGGGGEDDCNQIQTEVGTTMTFRFPYSIFAKFKNVPLIRFISPQAGDWRDAAIVSEMILKKV